MPTDMVLKAVLCGERFLALHLWTRVGLFTSMRSQVGLEMVTSSKRLATPIMAARVRLLSSVDSIVLPQIGQRSEVLVTPRRSTIKGLPRMEPLVGPQTVQRIESLVTPRLVTLKWLLSGVNTNVNFQRVRGKERLATIRLRAGEHVVPQVGLLVSLQIAGCRVGSRTARILAPEAFRLACYVVQIGSSQQMISCRRTHLIIAGGSLKIGRWNVLNVSDIESY